MELPLAFTPGPSGMLIILVLAVLLFGKRLPEVARSVGRGLMELRKGLRDIEREVRSAIDSATSDSSSATGTAAGWSSSSAEDIAELEEATAPKFEPPPQPQQQSSQQG
jgi:sec-independent protein translocase protein TatA